MSESLPPRDDRGPETGIQPGIPPMPLPNRHETIAYQPVSAWAVAGLVTSGLFALLVFSSTMVALYQGAPVFFPLWMISLAVAGIVFSFVGVNHVHNSEGTRTGAKLARTGIWLGVVSALCYFSYYFATRYAQETQADTFLRVEGVDAGFFPLLSESSKPGSLNRAFLLTRPFTARSGNPDNPKSMALTNDTPGKEGGKGDLSNFKESVLPRVLFKDLAKDAEITPLAVQDWKYEKKSYQIVRNYMIKTKEVEVEMQLSVASTESEASGQGRKWFVNLRESGVVKQSLTPYGQGVSRLRFLAREWLGTQFLDSLNKGQSFAALKDMDQTHWDNLILQDQKPDEIRASLYRLFRSSKVGRLQGLAILTRAEEVGFWELADGKVRFHLNFRLATAKETGPPAPSHVFEGFVTVESRQAVDPGQFDVSSPPPEWALIGITVTNVSPPSSGPGAPGLTP